MLTSWVEWVQSFSPVLQAHVPPEYPWWSAERHVEAARLQQRLVAEASGVVPTVFVALQRNVKRGYGWHSHLLLCGSEALLRANRRAVWREFRRRVAAWPGVDQPGYFRLAGAGREWVPGVPNECRYRLTPVFGSTTAITRYVVRYCLREDQEQALEVLRGDAVGTSGSVEPLRLVS